MTQPPPALPDVQDQNRPTHQDALISTFIYPGLGQWAQGRRRIGMIILSSMTMLFLLICWVLLRPAVINTAVLFELGGKTPNDALVGADLITTLVTPYACTLYALFTIVYLVNVIDVWRTCSSIRKGTP